MEVVVENGVTIIRTGDAVGGVKNKFNQIGVAYSIQPDGTKLFRASIQVNRKKYHLGLRDTLEEAVELRKEAERQVANNTFSEWHKSLKVINGKMRRKPNSHHAKAACISKKQLVK